MYVRLWYRTSAGWKYSDEQYKGAGIGPQITDPVPGTAPDGPPIQFNWTDNGIGVEQWWLYAGHRPGMKRFRDSGNLGTATSDIVDYRIFPDGDEYTVRLWFRTDKSSFWKHSDFSYSTTD